MKIGNNFLKIIMVGALLSSFPLGTSAEKLEKKHVDYVALGDSLAAGYTPYGKDEQGNPKKFVDGPGYPEFLKDRFEQSQYSVELKNYAVNGYKSKDLLIQLQNNQAIQEKIAAAELITIDIGANDLLYALKNNKNLPIALLNLHTNLREILTNIKTFNPKAEVYMMGYYNPFPYLPQEQQQPLLPLLTIVNDVIENNTVEAGYTFVPTDKIIAKKVEEYIPTNDIHLNEAGYQLVAKEFWKAIGEQKQLAIEKNDMERAIGRR